MGFKNSKKKQNINDEVVAGSVEMLIRKSKLTATCEFDYQKLCKNCVGLLECKIERKGEYLNFIYDTKNVKSWSCILKESKEFQMLTLLDVKKLLRISKQYSFMLEPENLYYDIHGRIYVRDRDVYGTETMWDEGEFYRQYISLIGCTFSKKYTFQDYYEGGMDLLQEDNFLSEIAKCPDTEEVVAILYKEYESYKETHRNNYIEVVKKHYYAQKSSFAIICMVAMVALVISAYLTIWERPFQKAVIAANEAYLQLDYEATIEAMNTIDVDRMNSYQKYILAISSVKCENFNDKNEKNILNSISLNGDEKVMEYWIFINRLEMQKAQDIAMQFSSEQLLYYAYLKEKVAVENDSTMTGAEKQKRLSELEMALEPLKDEYSSLTEE